MATGDGPRATIERAIDAYRSGNEESLGALLHEDVRLIGSEHYDNWANRGQAVAGLRSELARHHGRFEARAKRGDDRPEMHISGSLLDPSNLEITQVGDVAWAVLRGSLEIDDREYADTTWSVLLRGDDGDWKIAHSHFSIHP